MDDHCKYWFNRNDPARYVDRMERRQAEFLVHERFPLALVTRIGVANEQARTVVSNIIAGAGLAILRPFNQIGIFEDEHHDHQDRNRGPA